VLHTILLVFELVARAAGATTLRAAALDHEIGDHAVEDQAVIEAALDQVHEVGDRQRRLVGEQLDLDRALGGVESGDEGHADPWDAGCVISPIRIHLPRGMGGFDHVRRQGLQPADGQRRGAG